MCTRFSGSLLAKTAILVIAMVLTASCAVRTTSMLRDPNTVRIALNSWVGYEADAAVIKYLLEHELDYKVQLVQLDEQPSWQALDQGAIDVILENWGHEDLMSTYGPQGNDTVRDGGPNGNIGHIGWYMPKYLVEQYPGINTPEGLKKHADVFQTAESGDKGQFLAGAPGFLTNDQGMINHFDLPFDIVYAGSEASQLTEVQKRYKKQEPVLFYSQAPGWIQRELDLVRVKFPKWSEGCDDNPKDISCDYPKHNLNKIYRKGFADEGSRAFQLIDRWKWSNNEQNKVSQLIADKGMENEAAAKAWVRDNPDVWKSWIPRGADK